MKKIIFIILALALSVCLFACGDEKCDKCVDENKDAKCDVCGGAVACEACIDENKDAKCDVCGKAVDCAACVDTNKDGKCDVCGKADNINIFEDFENAMKATKPTSINGTVTVATSAGKMVGEYSATIADDGAITVSYEFDSFNGIGDGSNPDVSTKKVGKVIRSASGEYSYEGDVLAGADALVSAAAVKLDKSLMSYSVSKNSLNAFIESENTESVLGVALDSDATLALVINEGKVVSLALVYDIDGANVSLVCEYK